MNMNFNTQPQHQGFRPSLQLVGGRGFVDSLDCKVRTNNFSHVPAFDRYTNDVPTAPAGFSGRSSAGQQQVFVSIEPTDVLCGRGKMSFNHVGNKRFRDLIGASTDKYNNARSRLEKSMVVHSIVEEVKQINGRFLKQDRYSGGWYELDERQAKEKVGHAIRDATSSIDPKKKSMKRTKSKSSSTSPIAEEEEEATKDMLEQTASEDSENMNEDASLTRNITSSKESEEHSWEDDLEPLHVDSLEAQNSLTALQNDDHFLKRMKVVLGETIEGDESSNHYFSLRLEII